MIVAGIPTLNRYDLLEGAIESLCRGDVVPDRILVVDNGGNWEPSATSREPVPLEIIRPGRNLGVAASWNLLHRITAADELILLNDDVLVAPETLQRMVSCPQPFVAVSDTPGFAARRHDPGVLVSDWACFLQRAEVWRDVGEYDEQFWPAYYEDADYDYRMRLAGQAVTRLPCEGLSHHVSSSLRRISPEQRTEFERAFRLNAIYYQRKWGGPPGTEQFLEPWNGDPVPVSLQEVVSP